MSSFAIDSNNADDTKSIARALGSELRAGDAVSLVGDLGAGKTNFVQGVAEALGIKEPITSPTFNLVFEYRNSEVPLFHFDLYRIDEESELEDIDFYYLTDSSSDGASFVEWADKFPDAMPDDMLKIEVRCTGDTSRRITVDSTGPRSQELLAKWEAGLKGTS